MNEMQSELPIYQKSIDWDSFFRQYPVPDVYERTVYKWPRNRLRAFQNERFMRLVEIVEGDATSPETIAAAIAFAQRIRKAPITCAEVPGFVVNRILNSAISEIWRAQEEEELDTRAVDQAVQESRVAPMGPYLLTDLLGLDTVLHVAQHLEAAYGDRFYVHAGMRDLVAAGNLGQKTGRGFYEHGD